MNNENLILKLKNYAKRALIDREFQRYLENEKLIEFEDGKYHAYEKIYFDLTNKEFNLNLKEIKKEALARYKRYITPVEQSNLNIEPYKKINVKTIISYSEKAINYKNKI